MYRTVVFVLVLCCKVLTQPVTQDPSTRHARELIECCPCPGSIDGGQGQDILAGGSQLARAGDLDDCPCRARGADAEGASSIFFPSAVRPDGPVIRQNDQKDDAKNLLEPEVALATSMLDTLREATEEEYRDALARDAARSATEQDAEPEESARKLVIIVNPRESDNDDEMISEASHVQESRCIHPLGNVNIGRMKFPTTPVTSSFYKLKRPGLSHRNIFDMDSNVEASNVEPSIIDDTRKSALFTSRTPMFKLTTPLKNLIDNRDNTNLFKNPSTKPHKMNQNKSNFLEGLKFPLAPKLKSYKNVNTYDDISSVPSNVQNYSHISDQKPSQLFTNAKLPLNLRNLLKLKDVELVPNRTRNKPFNNPRYNSLKLAFPSPITNHKEINFKNSCNEEIRSASNKVNIQANINNSDVLVPKFIPPLHQINKNCSFESGKDNFEDCETETLDSEHITSDVLSSPSQVQPTFLISDDDGEQKAIESTNNKIQSVSDISDIKSKELTSNSGTHLEKGLDGSDVSTNSNLSEIDEDLNGKDSENLDLEDEEALTIEALNKVFDTKAGASNAISTLVPLEAQERKATNLLPQNQDFDENLKDIYDDSLSDEDEIDSSNLKIVESIEILPQIKTITPLSETLSKLRESVVKNLKIPSEFIKSNDQNEKAIFFDERQDFTLSEDNTNPKSVKTLNKISMNDLQDMSDNLLNLNSINKLNETTGTKLKDDELFLKSTELDSETNEKSSEAVIDKTKGIKDGADDLTDDGKFACPINIKNSNTQHSEEEKSEIQDLKLKEMETGESNTITKTLPDLFDSFNSSLKSRTSLLESIVYPSKDPLHVIGEPFERILNLNTGLATPSPNPQVLYTKPLGKVLDIKNNWPNIDDHRERLSILDDIGKPSSDPLKLLRKPLENLLNVNTNLPTFDDLQARLGNIFNTNDRSNEDESTSIESECSNNSPTEMMAPEATTKNFQTKLPPLKNIDDFNVDIFRNKPLTSIDNFTKPTKFNSRLNSYHVDVPTLSDLERKPFKTGTKLNKLARTGIERPSLIFQPDRKTTAGKPSQTLTSSLVSPLEDLPSLDELRNTLRSNTKKILNKQIPQINIFDDIRSNDAENIAETIRQNTQKTMKGLQQKMKSALRKTKINGPLGNPFEKPQELLDDVHDKLKGIHYDLNDRLSSIHEDIMDSSKFKTLFDQPHRTSNKNVMTNLRQHKTKHPPARLQMAASTIATQEIDPNEHKLKNKDVTAEPRHNKNSMWNNLHNVQTSAESILTPARAAQLQLAKPSLFDSQKLTLPLRHSPSLKQFIRERKPLQHLSSESTNLEGLKRPIFRTVGNPFKNEQQPNKVTISFGTTTPMPQPVFQPRGLTRMSPQLKERTAKYFSDPSSEKVLAFTHKLKSEGDTKILPSENKLIRISAPMPVYDDENFADSTHNFSEEQNHVTNSRPPVLRQMSNYKTSRLQSNLHTPKSLTILDDNTEMEIPASKPSANNWPKYPENSFLSKVREAVNTRLSSHDTHDSKLVKNVDVGSEHGMLRSPSENTNIILDEPLKENVSYKCRMVCTKEFS